MADATIPAEFTFQQTEEQLLVRDTARHFAETEILPHVMEWDEIEHFPLELFRKMGELGFLGIIFPPEYGGAGMDYVDYVTIVEEISRVDPSIGLGVAALNGLGTNHIYRFGSEEVKRKYLPDLLSGKKLSMWALTEPDSGSDAGAMKTTAKLDGDYWILNGNKVFITHGSVGDTAVIMAVTDPEKGTHGISAFVLEKGMEGFIVVRKENKLGMRASDTAALCFEDVKVPRSNLLGDPGLGFKQALSILDGGRISIAALSIGVALGAFEAALKYSKERIQFGQPIAEFQATQFKLAQMATEIEASRLLTYKSAALKDQGQNVNLLAAQAKLFASETAIRVSNEAVQIFGGYGYVKDYPVEKFYRDSKLLTIGEGTSEIQRMVIGRSLFKE